MSYYLETLWIPLWPRRDRFQLRISVTGVRDTAALRLSRQIPPFAVVGGVLFAIALSRS